MSETSIDQTGGMTGQGSGVLGSDGRAMNRARPQAQQAARAAQGTLEEVGDYVRRQPVSAALIALGVGYILGRLHIL